MKIVEIAATDIENEKSLYDLVVYSTFFEPNTKYKIPLKRNDERNFPLAETYFANLKKCADLVKLGGSLFVYGIPSELPYYAAFLNGLSDEISKYIFKYWIVLRIDERKRGKTLRPVHQGLLFYIKSSSTQRSNNGFSLNVSNVKNPHKYCSFCKKNLKDWGGKKHLMNPEGSALSDVWSDFPLEPIINSSLPQPVKKRLISFLDEESNALFVEEVKSSNSKQFSIATKTALYVDQNEPSELKGSTSKSGYLSQRDIEFNRVYQEDCISFMDRLAQIFPEGIFDLVFADPPYNLSKGYEEYQDDRTDIDYIQWCNKWLSRCANILKPGGSLMVLNLPKWAAYHAVFLNKYLDFRHWICWDALADPRGKLLPAHYALLYYTKPGADIKFRYSTNPGLGLNDYVEPPDSPEYCLRQNCIIARKKAGHDIKTELSDIWFDVHRIKHKRDRDYHPCQLPEKLMDRIIRLTTDQGDRVFDPFAGVGTTAVVAKRLGRDFITCEIDSSYIQIINEKIQRADGDDQLLLSSPQSRPIKKAIKRSNYSKKEVEIALQKLALRLGRVPTVDDIQNCEAWIMVAVEELYEQGIRQPLKAAKLALKTNDPLNQHNVGNPTSGHH